MDINQNKNNQILDLGWNIFLPIVLSNLLLIASF
jgi:NADH:ubiquinone oxidoreductase subunit H